MNKPLCILLVFCLFTLPPEHVLAENKIEPTKVGVILPLTGEFAAWGAGIRRGIELFAEGREQQFKFDFEDEGSCEGKKSLAAYRKFVSQNIKFVILGCLAGTKAILPSSGKNSVLLLSVGLVDDATFKQTSQLVNLATQLSTESSYLARRVVSKGLKRVAIIHWVDAFSEEFAATLKAELERLGSNVVLQTGVAPKDQDYRPTLLKIKSKRPDAICFNVGQDQQDILLRQIDQLGLNIPVFSNYVFETEPVLKLGKLLRKVEYSFPLNSAEQSPEKLKFDSQFQSRFGKNAKPIANTYFIYDGLILLESAMRQCPDSSPQCVNKIFKSTREFEGLSGQVSFLADGSNIRPYGIKKVIDGKFSWVRKYDSDSSRR